MTCVENILHGLMKCWVVSQQHMVFDNGGRGQYSYFHDL